MMYGIESKVCGGGASLPFLVRGDLNILLTQQLILKISFLKISQIIEKRVLELILVLCSFKCTQLWGRDSDLGDNLGIILKVSCKYENTQIIM